jgi:hypothetical protein
MLFAHNGMAQWMGMETQKSWAHSHVHIVYVDATFDQICLACTDQDICLKLACIGHTN